MKHKKTKIAIIAALFAIASYQALAIAKANTESEKTVRTTCDTECIKHIQGILDDYRIENKIPGMQMTISIDNQPMQTFASGTVDRAGTKPVTKDTLFEIGSTTKSFTAAIILKLASEGKLSLNDTVGKWFPNQYPAWKDVTIEQLLHMTSPVFDTFEYDGGVFRDVYIKDANRIWTVKELIDFAYNHGPVCSRSNAILKTPFCAEQPGKGWAYSNTNYILLGAIAEKASGKKFKTLMYQEIFKPLGLKTAIYNPEKSPAKIKGFARAYDYVPNSKTYQQDVTAYSLSAAQSAGAIIMTLEDLARWTRGLFTGKVLSAKELAALTNTVCMADNPECKAGEPLPANAKKAVSYGYGVMRIPMNDGKHVLWLHLGGSLGHTTLFVYDKNNDFVFTVAQNTVSNNKLMDLAGKVEKYLFPNMGQK